MTEENPNTVEKIAINYDLVAPRMYNIIFMNDDITTMEFVVNLLIEIFNYDDSKARELAFFIDSQGSAVVATLPYEIAEQKSVEATLLARNSNFPLNIKLEES